MYMPKKFEQDPWSKSQYHAQRRTQVPAAIWVLFQSIHEVSQVPPRVLRTHGGVIGVGLCSICLHKAITAYTHQLLQRRCMDPEGTAGQRYSGACSLQFGPGPRVPWILREPPPPPGVVGLTNTLINPMTHDPIPPSPKPQAPLNRVGGSPRVPGPRRVVKASQGGKWPPLPPGSTTCQRSRPPHACNGDTEDRGGVEDPRKQSSHHSAST